MNFRLLAYRKTNNLGDAIQTIALSRLLAGQLSGVYRDAIRAEQAIKPQLIVNGYLNGPCPPKPLGASLIGIHTARMEAANWCKLEGKPVYARDSWSLKRLRENGCQAEWIGCATMTLPKYTGPRSGVVVVDLGKEKMKLPSEATFLSNFPPYPHNISWQTQWDIALTNLELVKKAAMVYTNRLHIILPCLAFGTPVYCPSTVWHGLNTPQRFSLLKDIGFEFDKANCIDLSNYATNFKSKLAELIGQEIVEHEPVFPVTTS